MIFNTSSAEVLDQGLSRDVNYALVRHTLYAGVGIAVAYLLRTLGYRTLLRMSTPLFIGGVLLLILVLIPGVGISANGSRRWLGAGGITFQPSELVKHAVILFTIQQIIQKTKAGPLELKPFYRLMGIVALPVALIALEPNNGTAAVIVFVVVSLLFLTGVRLKYWALPMAIGMGIVTLVAFQLPYVTARFQSYLHPERDLLGKGHQPHQAKIAAGSGQLFGKGPGQSIQKLSYLPEAQNDYIAAIFAEEFGFLGILGLLSLYLVLIYAGFHFACYAPDREGCFLAAGITFLIGTQAFLNLAVVSGMFPSTGLNLPFFSQGGTSLMVNLGALGILMSISDATEKLTNRPAPKPLVTANGE